MFCPKCGNQNSDGAAFCGNCGEILSRNEGAGKQAVPNGVSASAAASGPTSMSPAGMPALAASGSSVALEANKTGRIIGIVIAAVVVVLVIVAFATGGFGLFGSMILAGSNIGVEPKPSVNAYSWDELSKISEGIAKASNENEAIEIAKKYNLVNSEDKLDGSQVKSITLTNGKEAQIQIVGFAHDNKTGGGKAGMTFIFNDVIAEHSMNSSNTIAGGWKDSQMRSWLASDGMNLLPSDLRSRIVAVDKMTNNIGETKNVSSVTSTSDKLWLFSYVELCGGAPKSYYSSSSAYLYDIYQAEGTEYKLFKDCNVVYNDGNSILTKNYNGSSSFWWERSPDPRYSVSFNDVHSVGHPTGTFYASTSYGVVPGFCI